MPQKSMFFTLDDNYNEVGTNDVLEWGQWFSDMNNRRIGYIETRINDVDVTYSTVCLGMKTLMNDGYETAIIIDGNYLELIRHGSFAKAFEFYDNLIKTDIDYVRVGKSRYHREYKKYQRTKKKTCCIVGNVLHYNFSL